MSFKNRLAGAVSDTTVIWRSIPLILLLGLWQYLVQVYRFGDGFIPSPVEVVQAMTEWVFGGGGRYSGTWAASLRDSAGRVICGFLVALAIGAPLGILMGSYRVAANLVDPVLQLIRPIPTVAWIPFCLIFFGIGNSAAIALVAVGAFFPIVLNAMAGARQVSPLHLRSALMLGATRFQILSRVVVPSALPSLLVGARVAIGLAWMLVVISEMVAVKSGLGYELWDAYYYNRMDVVVAAMATVGLFGFLSDLIVQRVVRRYLFWHQGTFR
ncbi:NitT/TauT family transport system permease protein [Pseudochelatococcus lubricantis]|uniref:NitT/TauT family transport system permease protein n=1 Tax=Pseudochelatococcus lubricantis TaxID=1538102 RepID=A0ABX0UV31_9HYPH|nr:ABC transporter permease [Pseudochelatococcus lubricantis]NIJ56622.1 NitT/TauT family transport system permease protein [Pseudochelatococcus lubricantis]